MTSVQTVDAGLGDRRWLWLTVPIGLLLAGVSLAGLLVPNLYRGAEAWIVQAVAQDFIDLVLVLPVLALSAWRAGRGSHRGWLIWLGTLTYLVYTFVIYAFAVPHKDKLKGFVWVWMERVDPKKPRVPQPKVVAVLVASLLDKDFLGKSDPEKFFTEPHYDGFKAVLVRLAAITVRELRPLITDAWRCQAPKEAESARKPARKSTKKKSRRPAAS
jgi:hypothetical protein